MRGVVPFGPFLAIGIAVTMFVGDRIIEYYISFIK